MIRSLYRGQNPILIDPTQDFCFLAKKWNDSVICLLCVTLLRTTQPFTIYKCRRMFQFGRRRVRRCIDIGAKIY